MKTSIATVSLGGTLREKLEAIAAAGFDGVEMRNATISGPARRNAVARSASRRLPTAFRK